MFVVRQDKVISTKSEEPGDVIIAKEFPNKGMKKTDGNLIQLSQYELEFYTVPFGGFYHVFVNTGNYVRSKATPLQPILISEKIVYVNPIVTQMSDDPTEFLRKYKERLKVWGYDNYWARSYISDHVRHKEQKELLSLLK
jgi:hypothetical protein